MGGAYTAKKCHLPDFSTILNVYTAHWAHLLPVSPPFVSLPLLPGPGTLQNNVTSFISHVHTQFYVNTKFRNCKWENNLSKTGLICSMLVFGCIIPQDSAFSNVLHSPALSKWPGGLCWNTNSEKQNQNTSILWGCPQTASRWRWPQITDFIPWDPMRDSTTCRRQICPRRPTPVLTLSFHTKSHCPHVPFPTWKCDRLLSWNR